MIYYQVIIELLSGIYRVSVHLQPINLPLKWELSYFWYFRISRRATVPGLYLCGFFTPPVVGSFFPLAPLPHPWPLTV